MIFDLYGTLIDIHTDEERDKLWEKLADHYQSFGAAYQPFALRDRYFALVHEEERGKKGLRNDAHEAHPEIQLERVFQALFAEKGVTADTALVQQTGGLFRAYSTDYLRLYDGAKELLTALRKNGKKVWLLSNAQRMFTEYELKALDLETFFDGIYLSSDYSCKKPDSTFFHVLLDEQRIDPKTAVMVGNDGACDIEGAKKVGLSTVYIHSNLSPREPFPKADHILTEMNLKKLERILLE